jgi:FkbM family methyltransferase
MINALSLFLKYAKLRYRLYRVILRLKMGKKKRDKYIREKDIRITDFLPERPYLINGIRAVPRKFTNDFDMLSWPREEILSPHLVMKNNETFVDVGANVGKYSLTIANDYKDKSVNVIAIEAQPENYKALCRNIEVNDFKNKINAINKAVSDHKGNVTMYEYLEYGYRTRFETFTIVDKVEGMPTEKTMASSAAAAASSSLSSSSPSPDRIPTIQVEADTLDNILSETGTKKVDVMKIDIEGAEVMALKGATNTLKQLRKIIVEIHNYNFEPVRQILERYNFKLDIIKEDWGEKGEIHGYIIGQK